MPTRSSLIQTAVDAQLNAAQTKTLLALPGRGAGLPTPKQLMALSALFGGAALIMWIAANWQTLSRTAHFTLLELAVLLPGLLCLRPGPTRTPSALLCFLAIGGLWAYFGQTYQTGADPWQLFALWAVLSLPLCFFARSDLLWLPWSLVWMASIYLWINTQTGHHFALLHVLLSNAAAWGCVVFLGRTWRSWTGASLWGLRSAVVLATLHTATLSLSTLLDASPSNPYAYGFKLGVPILLLAFAWFQSRAHFDIFALSALALALNAQLFCWLIINMNASPGSEDAVALRIALFCTLNLVGSAFYIFKLTQQHKDPAHE